MRIILAGLNHKTASVDVREQLAFDSQQARDALMELKGKHPAGEFVLLSTCNRVEIYCATEDEDALNADELVKFLSDSRKTAVDEFKEYLYILYDGEAVRHLLTVTASLDSMVVGESQINAQVKESFRLANRINSAGKVLSKLFHCAFSTSKDIYTNTSINSRRVSVAGVAVELSCQLFEDITAAEVKVIGAGEMGELLVEHFLHIKCENITLINRSEHRGKAVAEEHGVASDMWENLDENICQANIVVGSATATQGYLFDKRQFEKIMHQRKGKTLLIVDIAVPRSFDPAINELENVYLYSVDDLAQVVHENTKLREDDVENAVEIICQQSDEFMDWFETWDIGPLIGQIKGNFDRIRRNEMERFFVGEREDAGCKEVMEQTVSRVVNKLLHCVIKNINSIAKNHSVDEAKQLADNIARQAKEIISEDVEKKDQ